jgi:hypothetical protein
VGLEAGFRMQHGFVPKAKVVYGLEPEIGGRQDMYPDIVADFDAIVCNVLRHFV